ncbi:hypothetical protein Gotri_006108 [Gossypium trilobum]|uniref:Uncharacterized protein n=1 Tax=Gossypium trilobum TaxID=34281 RepID=A0A7J9EZT5_9ROSI|nr:hypothetical protein [Gossypium trilobum]
MSLMVTNDVGGASSNGDHTTKNVRFKRIDVDMNSDVIIYSNGRMAVDPPPTQVVSWKDKVVRNGSSGPERDEDIEFLDRFRHVKEGWLTTGFRSVNRVTVSLPLVRLSEKEMSEETSESFGPWMLIEKKSRQGNKRELGPVNSAGNEADHGSILVDNTGASLGELSQPNLKGNGATRLNTQAAWVEENMLGSHLNAETNSGMKLISAKQEEVPPTELVNV